MEHGRAVRIVRSSSERGGATARPADFRPNRSGSQRAWRLFGLDVLALAALYAVVLALLSRGPGGITGNADVLAVLAGLAVAIGVVGFYVTLGQAPRGIWTGRRGAVVEERLGRRRELAPSSESRVARRFPAGWLASGPTEIVRVVDATGRPRVYLVDEGLVPLAPNPPP